SKSRNTRRATARATALRSSDAGGAATKRTTVLEVERRPTERSFPGWGAVQVPLPGVAAQGPARSKTDALPPSGGGHIPRTHEGGAPLRPRLVPHRRPLPAFPVPRRQDVRRPADLPHQERRALVAPRLLHLLHPPVAHAALLRARRVVRVRLDRGPR